MAASARSTRSSSRPARGQGGWPARSAIACCWKASVATTPPCPSPGVQLRAEVIFGERKFVATPLAMGLRIGGAAEFAGLEAPPNYARCDALLSLAALYLPGLRAEGRTRWMGHRPTTPDSLPVIGRSPRRRDVLYAFGHGHIGLTARADDGPSDRRSGRRSAIPARPRAVLDRTVRLSGLPLTQREPPCVSAG